VAVEWDWSRVVFDHVKIGVRDAEASKTFYRTGPGGSRNPPLWEGEHSGNRTFSSPLRPTFRPDRSLAVE
jgi:catechol 2,3-dioxygenase-like lactoylglutathione lyase family enzyme